MDRMLSAVVGVRIHPVILSSCLSLHVSFLSGISVSGLSNAEGQQREPAICNVRIPTRRAGWLRFAGPSWFGDLRYMLIRETKEDNPRSNSGQDRIAPKSESAALYERRPS